MALPGRGSSLVAGAQTATVTREEIERLVLGGFFPACDARARPYRTQAASARMGTSLCRRQRGDAPSGRFPQGPPARGCRAVQWRFAPPAVLRQRLLDQIAAWQDGSRRSNWRTPNRISPSRAAPHDSASCCTVSRGASRRVLPARCFSKCRRRRRRRTRRRSPALVCVLPRNASAEQVFEINLPGLEVRTDQLVSFQAYSSTRHGRCRAGDVLPWDADAFHALPPLQTIIRTADGPDAGPDRTVPVRLAAKMNALGLLQISCVSMDPRPRRSWPLEFNLRPHEHGTAAARGSAAAAPD